MVVGEEGSTARMVLDASLASAGIKPVFVMELGRRDVIREAVAKGIGTVPAYTPDPWIRMVRLLNADAWTETHVYCLEARRSARAVKVFLEIAGKLASARASRVRPVTSV